VSKYQDAYDKTRAQHKARQKRLDRLKSMKHTFQSELESFSGTERSFSKVHSSLTQSDFKGSNRRNFDGKFDSAKSALSTEKAAYDKLMNKIERKISALEMDQSSLGNAMVAISSTISGLWAML
jgi:DNA repair ATPase RecN